MNKIRTKGKIAFILVDPEGNFSEITDSASNFLIGRPDFRYEYICISRDEHIVVTDEKNGNLIHTSEWGDCTVAQGIDGYYTEVFTNDALYELQCCILKGKLTDINIHIAE